MGVANLPVTGAVDSGQHIPHVMPVHQDVASWPCHSFLLDVGWDRIRWPLESPPSPPFGNLLVEVFAAAPTPLGLC